MRARPRQTGALAAIVACACGSVVDNQGPGVGSTSTTTSSTGTTSADASGESTTTSLGEAETSTTTAVETGATTETTTSAPDLGVEGCPVEWLPPVCWADACEHVGCGDPWDLLDADGCARAECITDDECPQGRYCNPRFLSAPCFDSFSCADEDGTCLCGGSLGCWLDARGYCLDAIALPPDDMCAASHVPCEELANWIGHTAASISDAGDDIVPPLATRMAECQAVRVDRAIEACGIAPCDLVCTIVGSVCGGETCESVCEGVDPQDAIAFATLIAATPRTCSDCEMCEATGNPLCAAIAGCS